MNDLTAEIAVMLIAQRGHEIVLISAGVAAMARSARSLKQPASGPCMLSGSQLYTMSWRQSTQGGRRKSQSRRLLERFFCGVCEPGRAEGRKYRETGYGIFRDPQADPAGFSHDVHGFMRSTMTAIRDFA